jgi:hypothetical protein
MLTRNGHFRFFSPVLENGLIQIADDFPVQHPTVIDMSEWFGR